MELILNREDVMRILCGHFGIEFSETAAGKVALMRDKIFWEGHEKNPFIGS